MPDRVPSIRGRPDPPDIARVAVGRLDKTTRYGGASHALQADSNELGRYRR